MLTSPVVRSLEQHTLHIIVASSSVQLVDMLCYIKSPIKICSQRLRKPCIISWEWKLIIFNEGITLTQKRYATEII